MSFAGFNKENKSYLERMNRHENDPSGKINWPEISFLDISAKRKKKKLNSRGPKGFKGSRAVGPNKRCPGPGSKAENRGLFKDSGF